LSFPGQDAPPAGGSAPDLPAELAFLERHGVPYPVLRQAQLAAGEAGVPPADALLKTGLLDERSFYRALAAETGLPFLGRFRLAEGVRFPQAVSAGLAALAEPQAGAAFVHAPQGAEVARLLGERDRGGGLVALTTPTLLRAAVLRAAGAAIARMAADDLSNATPALSYRNGVTREQAWAAVALLGAVGLAALLAPAAVLALGGAALSLLFLLMIVVRLAAVVDSGPVAPRVRPSRRPDHALPVYTVIVAMRREGRVLDKLVLALQALDYPPAKLDVKLVIDADDREMRDALGARSIPAHMEVVVAPPGLPRTKPRALNVALPLARGAFTVVYDAEDVPDPDQLRLAVDTFGRSGGDVACLQGRLVIDNTDDSLLTRFFTIEYAALFYVLNPGLAATDLPVPLGGTSTHFRTDILRAVHAWDPWNVTEDADLGIRLALLGYRVGDLPSSTLEEAPKRLGPWLHQRARWMKGFMQTCITHSRRPDRALRSLDPFKFVGAVTMTFGTVLTALLYPFLTATAAAAIADGALARTGRAYDVLGWGLGLVTLAAGALAIYLPPLVAIKRRGLWRLLPLVPFLPLYYALVSVAAWRGLFELVRDPYRWNKTDHGLAVTSRASQMAAELRGGVGRRTA